jgi:hypothetical protein
MEAASVGGLFIYCEQEVQCRFWHLADNPTAPAFVRYWSNGGHCRILERDGSVANGPERTFALTDE